MNVTSCIASPADVASSPVMQPASLGKRSINTVKTTLAGQSLARNTELASPFRNSRFEQWLGKRVTHDTEPSLRSLSNFWAEHHGGSVLNPSQQGTHRSLNAPSPAPHAQAGLALMSAPPPPAVAESAPTAQLVSTTTDSGPVDIVGVLKHLAHTPDTDDDSLSTLLGGLSRFIKDTQERNSPHQPGIHTLIKQLNTCLSHLGAGEAQKLLIKLEGKLGNSARAVTHLASQEAKTQPGTTRLRLSQCEVLLKGLISGLNHELHLPVARFSPSTPIANTCNELSPQERNAYFQALSAH